jgi:hypothetical protein
MPNTADRRQTVPRTVLPRLPPGQGTTGLTRPGPLSLRRRTPAAKPSNTARGLGTEHRRLAAARIAARLRIDLLGRAEIV